MDCFDGQRESSRTPLSIERRMFLQPRRCPSSLTPAPAPSPEPSVDLSNIECGAQELKERLDAGETVTVLDVRELTDAGASSQGLCRFPRTARATLGRGEGCRRGGGLLCARRPLAPSCWLLRTQAFNATSMDGGITLTEIGGETVPQMTDGRQPPVHVPKAALPALTKANALRRKVQGRLTSFDLIQWNEVAYGSVRANMCTSGS